MGTGLIGGSVGLAFRARAPSVAVVGYDADPAVVERAYERGAVTEVAASPEAAASGDLVFVATPVDQMRGVLAGLEGALGPETVVTDVASSKVEVVARGEALCGGRFVGGHPMAGSERHGIEAAHAGLFEDAWWIMTPTRLTSNASVAAVGSAARLMGARPVALEPRAHDALVARLSHVPQLAASALVELAASAGDRDALLQLAGPGFRDVTRIAASNPDLWVGILRSNRAAVLDALGGLGHGLDELRSAIARGRWDALRESLDRAREARSSVFSKPRFGGRPVTLTMLVADRPGVLAEVTTAAGELGANIEDLRIVHSTEGGRGRLELIVAGEVPAAALMKVLEGKGYVVDQDPVE